MSDPSAQKRPRSPTNGEPPARKRKSRFADAPMPPQAVGQPPPNPAMLAATIQAQKAQIAAALAKAQAQAAGHAAPPMQGQGAAVNPSVSHASVDGILSGLDMQKRTIAAQIANAQAQAMARGAGGPGALPPQGMGALRAGVPTLGAPPTQGVPSGLGMPPGRPRAAVKAQDFTLRVDAQGRAVDAKGNVIKESGPVRTLKANVQVAPRVNPYLPQPDPATVQQQGGSQGQDGDGDADAGAAIDKGVDPRIKVRKRDERAKRSFQFHRAGVFVKQDDLLQEMEQKKLRAGLTSGRNTNAYHKQGMGDAGETAEASTSVAEPEAEASMSVVTTMAQSGRISVSGVPPMPEETSTIGSHMKGNALMPQANAVPHGVEWWDVAFLPADQRRNPEATYEQASFGNSKFHRLVIHPVPAKPLGYEDKGEQELPVYLTSRERKRIRRQAREERRNELRDKIALGLVEAPEAKLKLANFMKVLGDQAVADPSRVERKVMEQVQQRVMNHEMRNLARKLTPEERRAKQTRKLTEDTSRQVSVALFRVLDLSNKQHQFKVDMNAQQNSLTGGALICKGDEAAGDVNMTLVVVEGGPKAIKRYTRLMMRRIKWSGDEHDMPDYDDDDDEYGASSAGKRTNRCDLVWTGSVIRRNFNGFRFQECKSATAARKVMESKGVAHYWDMVVRGDFVDASAYM